MYFSHVSVERQQKHLDDWCNKEFLDHDITENLDFEEELQAMKNLTLCTNTSIEVSYFIVSFILINGVLFW